MQETEKLEIQAAVDLATKAHAGQFRKGNGLPYISHPFSVLKIVADWGIDDVTIFKAAICHDVLEDCHQITRQQLLAVIGDTSFKVVEELTFIPQKGATSTAQQKLEYMSTFYNKTSASLVIKLADRCDNTKDFLITSPDYAIKYWRKADELVNAFRSRAAEIRDSFGSEILRKIAETIGEIEDLCYEQTEHFR